jgi:acyl carrier protein
LQPSIHTVFPLAQAAAAFRLMQQARHVGKIVLAVPARAVRATSAERAKAAPLLGRLSRDARPEVIPDYLQQQVARLLALDPAHPPNPTVPFIALGLDSLMTVELRNQLKADLGGEVSLSPSLLYDFPTIAALTKHLAAILGERACVSSEPA